MSDTKPQPARDDVLSWALARAAFARQYKDRSDSDAMLIALADEVKRLREVLSIADALAARKKT